MFSTLTIDQKHDDFHLPSNDKDGFLIIGDQLMTDSIKTTLKLDKISSLLRKDIAAKICTVTDPWGEITERYTKPSVQRSAMSKTKTKWIVRCAPDTESGLGEVPTHIDADLNIPNAVTGQNIEHGTSVFAAGVAALELQRIWLAKCGLPQIVLDLLSTEDIVLRGVTLTYLMTFHDAIEAQTFFDAINETGKVLNPKWELRISTNATVKLPARDHTVAAYIKSNFKHCKWHEDAPVSSILEQAPFIVRVEVKAGVVFLRSQNLLTLESWRNAHQDGTYEKLFRQTVLKSLRLDTHRLRHKAPREEVYENLTPTEAQLLRGYIAGRDPYRFKSITESATPNKRHSELRLRILDVANVDIDIPWSEHVKLRCFELVDLLRYPGDYHPAIAHAPWSFCKENWPNLLNKMRETYQAALAAEALRKSKPA